MGVETISLIIAAFVDGSLAFAALLRNFRSRSCLAFAGLATMLLAHDALSVLESFDSIGGPVATRIHTLVALLLGPAALWFLGEMAPWYRGRIRRWIFAYGPALLALAVAFTVGADARVSRWLSISAHVALALPAFAWMAVLSAAQKQAKLTRERLRLRYVFLSGVVAIALYTTDALHFAGFDVAPLGTLGRVLYVLFLFQTYVQKALMTVEELVAKLALFGGVSLLLSIIYLLLLSWVGDRSGLFFFNTFIASFASLVMLEPMRKVTASFTRKLFLRRNVMLEDNLLKLSQDLLGLVEPVEIHRRIGASLRRSLGMEAVALYVLDREGLAYDPVTQNQAPGLAGSSPLVEYMRRRRGRPFVLETVESDRDSFHSAQSRKFCADCVETLRQLGADFVIPFPDEMRLVGFVAVATGERVALSNEQLRLFAPLGRQVALLLESVRKFSLLRDRDKLAAVGEMAAGLAHEIRNPLGAIKGAAQLLREGASLGPQAEFLQIIVDESDRLSRVLGDFLDYAKPRRHVPQASCDPVRVIEHAAALLPRDLLPGLRVEIETERAGLTLNADPDALKQVLLNLFLNAVQAMENGVERPKLSVRVRELRTRRGAWLADRLPLYKIWEGWDAPPSHPASKPLVEIAVEDNGAGVEPEDLPRLFLPFFTTKPKGTGMGLAVCRRLVEAMGGTIAARPNRPSGSVFTIHLPADKELNA